MSVPQAAAGGASDAVRVARGHGHGHGPVEAFEKTAFFTHEHGLDHPGGATYLDRRGVLAVAQRHGG
ncbi:MAG TPA: hypothetical protein VFG63_06255, partial [Nocardioidaceae bacterium]|nr:hypothetical protein [Nocardioidaceae bacterium]